jgi:hypothetical protein
MKKILLPTDFSKNSEDLIVFALEAFNDEPCIFYFMHTYNYEVHGLDAISLLLEGADFFKEADLTVFKKMVDQVGYFANKVEYSKHFLKLLCKNAELIEGIQEAVEKLNIDIVLIGTQGEDPKTKQYKEDTVNKIIKEIEACPVMAVPLNEEAWASMGLEDIKMAS